MSFWDPGWRLVIGTLVVLAGVAVVAIYEGLYNIAADVPHTQPVYWLLETARERSVAVRARDIVVPNDLDDANRISKGRIFGDVQWRHLAPGMERTEISGGLYPRAPELRRGTDLTPAEQFWIIKHGVKQTGMPRLGRHPRRRTALGRGGVRPQAAGANSRAIRDYGKDRSKT